MKTKLLSLVSAIALMGALTGCNQPLDVNSFVKQVQAATVLACQFVPAVTTVAAIFTANSTLAVSAVATAICDAVTANQNAEHPTAQAPTIMVGKKVIPIEGQFVR